MTPALAFAHAHATKYFRSGDRITFGRREELDPEAQTELAVHLNALAPWRKGPFDLFGFPLDAHWKSELKWKRALAAADLVGGLSGKRVCDVGCNNGYYLYRIVEAGAVQAVGLDPVAQFHEQFEFLSALHPDERIEFHRAGFEALLNPQMRGFDVMLCMGVLYHQKNAFLLLDALRHGIARGGCLILETMGVDIGSHVLVPSGKFAGAGGVWMVPGPDAVESMLRRSGFSHVRRVDEWDARLEQDRTPLADLACMREFYDASGTQTVEGYPAPRRYLFLAQR